MARPGVARRADSLFDNRFRYDYIYPRGRSGEALRAYDTQDHDRPVVIKRPAPQDAPPLRAGQEVSILNEKRALERLSGHPTLIELRYSGNFRVGGQQHQYIVIDLAEGVTVEDYVLELASHGEHLPMLETLVILDRLLDLLEAAHAKQVAYNDVDAKHLFWDRAHYQLKVIDWGNASLWDIDTRVEPRAWKAIDAAQAIEVLYFILTSGRRLDAARGGSGDLPEGLPPKLNTVIARATDPDPLRRYPDITTLRRDLAEARRPLERSRDQAIERVRTRLAVANAQDELMSLDSMLDEVLALDPGYPPARELHTQIAARLAQLAIRGDLDAARIYIENGSPARARALLAQTYQNAGESERPVVAFLLATAQQLADSGLVKPPAALSPALDALFKGDTQAAGRLLITNYEPRPEAATQQMLLAEQLTLTMPGVVLLRPHIERLNMLLTGQPAMRSVLERAVAPLYTPIAPGVQPLRLIYTTLAAALGDLASRLTGEAKAAADRARQAATATADLLDLAAQNVLADPLRAGEALWKAGSIDPVNPAFEQVGTALNNFHADLETLSASRSGGDLPGLTAWLLEVRDRLAMYAADLPDRQFATLRQGVAEAIAACAEGRDALTLGGRRPAMDAYARAANAIRPLNAIVAGQFEELARQVEDARSVEALLPNVALGRVLSEGWDAWDRGRFAEAAAAAERGLVIAETDGERLAATRLQQFTELIAEWSEGNGLHNSELSTQTLSRLEDLLTPAERQLRQRFIDQMPNMTIYLKAMSRGLVEPLRDSSALGGRVLLVEYLLRGVIALNDGRPDDVNTWREAAIRAVPNIRLYPIYGGFEQAVTQRQLLFTGVAALNTVRSAADLPATRQAVRAPLVAGPFEQADQAIRTLDDAINRWADGDFYAAKEAITQADGRVINAEYAINAHLGYREGDPGYMNLTPFRQWLAKLIALADESQATRRVIEQAALLPSMQPDPAVASAHRRLVDLAWEAIGEEHNALIRQWRDTYQDMLHVYQNPTLTQSEKLRAFDERFASLFIDRFPAYPIFRHWQNLVVSQPDLPVQPVTPTVPQVTSSASTVTSNRPNFIDSTSEPAPRAEIKSAPDIAPIERVDSSEPRKGRRVPLALIGAVLAVIVIGAVIVVMSQRAGAGSGVPLTLSPSAVTGNAAVVKPTSAPTNAPLPTFTLPPTQLPSPTGIPIIAATMTTPPSLTWTPSATSTPSLTWTPSPQPLLPTESGSANPTQLLVVVTQATAAPSGIPAVIGQATGSPVAGSQAIPTDMPSGTYDLLQGLNSLSPNAYTWTPDLFAQPTAAPNVTGTPTVNNWQLGNTSPQAAKGLQVVRIGPSALDNLYGPRAALRVVRVDAAFTVTQYDPKAAANGLVYFGVGMETAQTQRAAAQAKVSTAHVFALGMSFNNQFQPHSLVPTGTLKVTLTAQRNSNHTVSLYANNQLLGTTTGNLYGPTVPVSIVLYTSAPGVVVSIDTLSIQLGA